MMSQPWRNVHKLITGYGVQRSNMLYCAPKRWELQCCALSSCNAKEIEGIPLKEYAARRKRLKDLMPEKGVAIQFGAPVKYMAPDVSYRFRQNSSLRYLTGFMEKDAVLLVFGKAMKEPDTLIVQTQDAHQDLWNGPCFGPDGAKEYTQIDHTSPLAELEKVVLEACMHASHVLIDTAKVLLMQLFAMNLPFLPSCVQVEHRTNSEQVFKTLNTLGIGSDQSQAPLAPLKPLLDELRLCKSSAEIKNIRKACNISGDAIQDAIKLSQADINESLLEANIEYGSRIRGASRLAYPPVIAGCVYSIVGIKETTYCRWSTGWHYSLHRKQPMCPRWRIGACGCWSGVQWLLWRYIQNMASNWQLLRGSSAGLRCCAQCAIRMHQCMSTWNEFDKFAQNFRSGYGSSAEKIGASTIADTSLLSAQYRAPLGTGRP
eukprot:m.53645 g.53645  ORF g.53645 m.53645 type:complete len:431 (+) comp10875_c0_seq7:219-1511(+)